MRGVKRRQEPPSVLFHPSSYPAATPALITCNSVTVKSPGRTGVGATHSHTSLKHKHS